MDVSKGMVRAVWIKAEAGSASTHRPRRSPNGSVGSALRALAGETDLRILSLPSQRRR